MNPQWKGKKVVTAILCIGIAPSLSAGTMFDCTRVLDMEMSKVEACVKQSNDWLEDSYQLLLHNLTNKPKQLTSLQGAQLEWVALREKQCKRSNTGIKELQCKALWTYKRAHHLEGVVSGIALNK